MCIAGSVGRNGHNHFRDVKTVQILLNLSRLPSTAEAIPEDGKCGRATVARIQQLQSVALTDPAPDGLVTPGGVVLFALGLAVPADLNIAILRGIMMHHQVQHAQVSLANAARYLPHFKSYMPKYGINTRLRKAHFLGQIALETNLLLWSEELASGSAYEDRDDLGNTEPGDGQRFKGRGLLQVTGRSNYQLYGDDISMNMLVSPNEKTLSTDPAQAVRSACWFWYYNNLNDPADEDNGTAVSRIINGRHSKTLKERAFYTARAKFFLK